MDQKKWETMDNVKIYYKRLIVLWAFLLLPILKTNAKSILQESVDIVLNCAVDINLKQIIANNLSENYILLFKTERSCIPCYKDMKEHYESNYPDHQVFVVIIMEEDYLQIDREITSIRKYYPDPTAFLLLFKNNDALDCGPKNLAVLIDKWIFSPSPFFVIKTDEKLKLIDSDATIEFIENKELYLKDIR